MDLKGIIKQVWICTWRIWLGECGDTPEGYDQVSLGMELLPMIMQTWRPELSEFEDVQKCHNRANLEEYFAIANLEAVKLDAVNWQFRSVLRLNSLAS